MNLSATKTNNLIDERVDEMREMVSIMVDEYNELHKTNFDVDGLFSFEFNSNNQCAEAKPRHTNARVMPVILFVSQTMMRLEKYLGSKSLDED